MKPSRPKKAARREPPELFREAVERHAMIPPGERVLAAVSGGADSVLLLLLLVDLRASLPFVLKVAHLNHGLRGRESDGDEAFVRDLAGRFSLPMISERADLRRRPGMGSSVEERAREARRAFLLRCARESGCTRIALGHTLDDQAETILMWLLRGTGRAGLAGMRPVTDEGVIRPLLRVRRSAVRDQLRSMGESHRDDATNEDLARTRNRIRRRVIPVLDAEFPGGVERLAAAAEILRGEETVLDEAARALIRSADGGVPVVDVAGGAGGPEALAGRALRLAAAGAGMDPRLLERDHIDAILYMARAASGTAGIDLPGGFRAECDRGKVRFVRREQPRGSGR